MSKYDPLQSKILRVGKKIHEKDPEPVTKVLDSSNFIAENHYFDRDYNRRDRESILMGIGDGFTISQVEQILNLRPNTIAKWLRKHPDFYEQFLNARKYRTFTFEDKMVELANMEITDPDMVKIHKFKFDAYSKLASYGNKEDFSTSSTTKHEHDGNVTISIDTGIKRENHGDTKEIEKIEENS